MHIADSQIEVSLRVEGAESDSGEGTRSAGQGPATVLAVSVTTASRNAAAVPQLAANAARVGSLWRRRWSSNTAREDSAEAVSSD